MGESNQISNAITQYKLIRLSTNSSMTKIQSKDTSNDFSLFNNDIDNLDVQISVSGTNMIRMTIRDTNAQRYEVPVPIQWNPSMSSSSKIKFQLTKTLNN
ncbi:unnamed protein product, partial [Adineta steineri]